MKLKELQEQSNDELATRKRDLRQESFHLRLQAGAGQLEKPSRFREIRREVARIETILTIRSKEKAAAPAAAK